MSTSQSTHRVSPAAELARRMRGPQRHRLLHGYPLASAMPEATSPAFEPEHTLAFDQSKRQLLVGVLPHPFCNPAVTGCGFCTFPHQPGNSAKTQPVVKSVISEINQTLDRHILDLLLRPVTALYFGGGTANLTEPTAFRDLCKCLAEAFELKDAEVTLEGVPAYFLRGSPRLLDIMRQELGARQCRLSMGIQTFNETRLKEMGRVAFGTPDTFREVVELGHKLGFTTSADLLFNLPGQTLDEMQDDLRRALDLGLDHIGLYHLVLFRGVGTPWAEDETMLAELPNNEQAADNWQALRELLLARGFVQTSLTNFEQGRYQNRPERYQYEECSFQASEYEVIGFGPSALSYVSTKDFAFGIKTMNPASAEEYSEAVKAGKRVWNKAFVYRTLDQKVLWLTRRLAALDIDCAKYRMLFDTDVLADFGDEITAACEAGLMTVTRDAIRPTPRGMFFADSIAAILASPAIRATRELGHATIGQDAPKELLRDLRENANIFLHM
ncbi:MAG: radical SAM protein [Planctomycetia bacterium]|nr:radical SAM protein [Planctomycetia bacterium]